MEARALSPRAARSCVIVDPRKGKERMGAAERNWPPESFRILKSARAPIAAHAPLLIVSAANSHRSKATVAVIIIVVGVTAAVVISREPP